MRQKTAVIFLLLLIALFAATSVFAAAFSFSGVIASGAQYDLYTVNLVAGQGVTATLVCDFDGVSRPLDPVLSVFFPGSDPSDVVNSDAYNDDGFGLDDDPNGVDCDAFDSSRVRFNAPVTGDYVFRADGFGSSTGPYTLAVVAGPLSGFSSGDARINQDAWAPVAIFCTSGGGVDVQLILSPSVMTPLLSASSAEIAAAAAGAAIAGAGGVELSATGDGGLQVLSPMPANKAYLFVWNGCPVSRTTTYTIDPVTGTTRADGTGGG
ncbi:MAG: hypothetical protein IAE89_16675 [Anaerolineae bacterium]|nr:hypothetical protein [Anaerolineae bacterium]